MSSPADGQAGEIISATLQSVAAIPAELRHLLLSYKQELMESAKDHLISNHTALQDLEERSGSSMLGSTEVYDAFVKAMAEWNSSLRLSSKPGQTQ